MPAVVAGGRKNALELVMPLSSRTRRPELTFRGEVDLRVMSESRELVVEVANLPCFRFLALTQTLFGATRGSHKLFVGAARERVTKWTSNS